MRGVLRFNLPEEQREFELAANVGRITSAMEDFVNSLRRMRKYESEKWDEKTLEAIWAAWFDAIDEIQGLLY